MRCLSQLCLRFVLWVLAWMHRMTHTRKHAKRIQIAHTRFISNARRMSVIGSSHKSRSGAQPAKTGAPLSYFQRSPKTPPNFGLNVRCEIVDFCTMSKGRFGSKAETQTETLPQSTG
jgi:hypothetical protein